MGIGTEIKRAREAAGISQNRLAKLAEVSNVSIIKWERDETVPSAANLKAVADALNIPVARLYGERDILLPAPLDSYAPVYGRIAAGDALEMLPNDDMTWIDPAMLDRHPNGFFLRVSGDSMNELMNDGVLAFFDPDMAPDHGDIVAVNINGYDATVKQIFYAGDTVVLHPRSHNDSYRDIPIDSEDPDSMGFRVLGVYTGWFKSSI